jgi:hypothetical protein
LTTPRTRPEETTSKNDINSIENLVETASICKSIKRTITISADFWTNVASTLLDKAPTTTAQELLDHISTTAREIPFMDAPEDRPGRYRLVRGQAETAAWLAEILRDRIDIEDACEAAARIVTSPEALAVLAADADGQAIIQAAEMLRRRSGITELRSVVEDPTSAEGDIHRVLRQQLWIFGGRFAGEALRRRLVSGNEVDIPLLRPDGSLCIVELKRATAPTVKYYRHAPVPTADVNDAVSQAVNYLVGLDENRQEILGRFSIDTRRANAIVLIGHPLAQPEVPESVQQETMRVHNATGRDWRSSATRSYSTLPTGRSNHAETDVVPGRIHPPAHTLGAGRSVS